MGEDFDERAATWDDDLERMARVRRVAAVMRSVVPLDGHPVTVELGSGTGMLARCLADVLGPTTLLDASPAMIEVASKALASERLEGWSAAVTDLAEGIPGGPYELALAQMFLHHVDDVPALLGELRRVMAPGGVQRYHATVVDFHGHHGFCHDELRGWLEKEGYRDVCFHDAGVVGKEVDGERQDFPMFLAVAKA